MKRAESGENGEWRGTYAAGQEESWPEDILGFEEGDLGEHEEDEGRHPR